VASDRQHVVSQVPGPLGGREGREGSLDGYGAGHFVHRLTFPVAPSEEAALRELLVAWAGRHASTHAAVREVHVEGSELRGRRVLMLEARYAHMDALTYAQDAIQRLLRDADRLLRDGASRDAVEVLNNLRSEAA
jgi:hypothetical protein